MVTDLHKDFFIYYTTHSKGTAVANPIAKAALNYKPILRDDNLKGIKVGVSKYINKYNVVQTILLDYNVLLDNIIYIHCT